MKKQKLFKQLNRKIKRSYRWFTRTRRRKILSSALAILILLTSIKFVFFNDPKKVLAAKMELTETSDSITINVPNRYRAILQKGDVDDDELLVFYDRYQNNANPSRIFNIRSHSATDENIEYDISEDANRKTTILEATNTKIIIRIEGCMDTATGGACLKDVDGYGQNVLGVTAEFTFTPEGVFILNTLDPVTGISFDNTDYNDGLSSLSVNWTDGDHYSTTVYAGDGNSESSYSSDEVLSNSTDAYVTLQGEGNYQNVIFGETRLNGDKFYEDADNGQYWYTASTEYISLFERSSSNYIRRAKSHSNVFMLLKPQSELDSEVEREGVFNDIVNPDTLDFTTGDLWDDKPLTSAGIATSSAVLFHNGFEGGDSNLCDGGDGWTAGSCGSGNTAVGNETTTVYDDTYSGKFNLGGTNDYAHANKELDSSYRTVHARFNFRIGAEGLGNGDQVFLIQFEDSTDYDDDHIKIQQDGSGNLELGVNSTADVTTWAGSDGYLQLNTWYTLEFKLYRHPSAGTLDLWLDGTNILSATSQNTGDYDKNVIKLGLFYQASRTFEMYYDNVIIAESYIGTAHYNEGQGAYTVDASSSHTEFDIVGGSSVSTLVNDASHIQSGATSVTVDSTSGFPDGGGSTTYYAYIEGDKFSYTDVDGTDFSGIPATGELGVIYHADNSVVSLPKRHKPSVKMRGYRDINVPNEAVLEGERLQKDYDFIADVKPFSDAYFADELLWHSTLESESSISNPDVGSAGIDYSGDTFVAGKYGKGIQLLNDYEYAAVLITGADADNFNKAKGAIEFWFQPTWAYDDNAAHWFFSMYEDANNNFYGQKDSNNYLSIHVTQDGTAIKTTINPSYFAWNAYDWVHLRFVWDDSASLAEQLRIFINGVEPTNSDDPESDDFNSANLTLDVNLNIGTTNTNEVGGIIDEFRIHSFESGADGPTSIAHGGHNYTGNERLASDTNNYTLSFVDDDASNRGEYIWLGSDSMFSGINVDLATEGVGSSEDFDWEYWDGTAWTALTVTEQETGASEWLADGNFYFTPPPDWIPYSVNGSTDLYYIRGHLEGGSYTTMPIENKVLTDIVTFQYTRYGGNISSENMTFEIPGWASGSPPIAHWKFDEGYGTTANDSTVNNHSLTVKDATWKEEAQCISGKCLHFDGAADMASRSAQLTQLDFKETNSFTLTGWFRHPSAVTGTDTLISKYESTGSDGGYKVYMNSSGYVCLGIDDDNTWEPDDSACSSTSYADSKWHHFSAVKSTTTEMSLYIDGQIIETDDNISADTTLENNDSFYIGADESGYQNYWDGFIDEVKVYRYARSADEIKVDYTGGATVFADKTDWLSEGLVGYWDMDEATGSATVDRSGNGNDGDLTNMQETGIAQVASTTTTVVDTAGSLSSTDDAYNGMILEITNGSCGAAAGEQQTISNYTGASKTITVPAVFSSEPDGCGYIIKHQIGGKYGSNLNFDGSNDCVNTSDHSSLGSFANMTIAFWVKFDVLPSVRNESANIVRKLHSGEPYVSYNVYGDEWNDSDRFVFDWGNDSNNSFHAYGNSGTIASTNTWYHVVSVKDESSLKIYVNGVDDTASADTPSGITKDSDGVFRIGANSSSTNRTDGNIDEVRIYNRALSPAEVSDLYQWAPGPIGHWKMDEGTGTSTTYDSSGNEHNGAMSGFSQNSWVTGIYGSALDFSYSADKVNIYSSSFNDKFNGSQGTVALWIRINDPEVWADQSSVLSIKVDDNNRILLYEASSVAQLSFAYDAGGTSEYCLLQNGQNLNWMHVAMTWNKDSDEVKYYKDGNLLQTDTSLGSWSGDLSSARCILGGDYISGGGTFDGMLDDIKVYNYARTPQQIVEDMNAGHPAPGSPIGSALHHFKFDEGYGDTANNSGTNTATANLGGSTSCPQSGDSNCPTWTNSGKFGKALDFDRVGATDDIAIVSNPSLPTTDYTYSVWAYHNDTNGSEAEYIIHAPDTSEGNEFSIGFENDDSLVVFSNGTTVIDNAGSTPPGEWLHIVVTRDGSAVTAYINGVPIGPGGGNGDDGTEYSFDTCLILGADVDVGGNCTTPTVNQHWDGRIDNLRIYNSALTSDQIKLLYNQGKAAVWGYSGTDSSDNPTYSALNEYCPPGQGSACVGPIAEWKFDEGTGTGNDVIKDSSGNEHHVDTMAGITESNWVPAKYGSGLNFDAETDDYLRVSDHADFSPTAITFMTWVKFDRLPSVVGESANIMRKKHGSSPFESFQMRVDNGDNDHIKVQVRDQAGNGNELTSNVPVVVDTWYHIAGVADGTDVIVYVNGVRKNSASLSLTSVFDADTYLHIGADFGGGGRMDGTLDEVKIYNYARTPAQIAWDYNQGKPIGHWRLDECQGATAYDSSGNGNDGTITIGSTDTTYTSVGACDSGVSTEAWNGGTTGKRNASIALDTSVKDNTTDDYVTISTTDLPTGDFTACAWFKTDGLVANWNRFILHAPGTSGSNELALEVATKTGEGERIYAFVDGNDSYGDTQLVDATWYHYCLTRSGSSVTMYLDAQVDGTTSEGASLDFSACDTLYFGTDIDTDCATKNQGWQGQIDEVKIYNYALTPLQVRTEFNSGTVRFGP